MTEDTSKAKTKKRGWIDKLSSLFPGFSPDDQDLSSENLAATNDFDSLFGPDSSLDKIVSHLNDLSGGATPDDKEDREKLIEGFPLGRIEGYLTLEVMSRDPTIDSALNMLVQHALSARTDSGEVVFIESTGDESNPVVEDIRNTFKDIFNAQAAAWGYQAAKLGVTYLRPYVKQGKGIVNIRHDFYTHPRHVKEYERAGVLAGYTSRYQQARDRGMVPLMQPWKFVPVKIPRWTVRTDIEPVRMRPVDFDIDSDDFENEEPIETQNYGSSLIQTAYDPWKDLIEAVLALNLARRNASKKDRIVGVNIGKEDPTSMAKYYNTLASQIRRKAEAAAKRALSKGYVNTVNTHMIPIMSTGSARLDIHTEDSSVDVSAIEDVNFHVNRLASALGVDKSLLGFTDDMAGGLGEGGFFRMSVVAAIKANLIRQAVLNAMHRLIEIHVFAKHGKIYTPETRPWKILFNSLNTAIEQEEASARESRINFATSVVTLMQILDPEWKNFSVPDVSNHIFTEMLKMKEDDFKQLFNRNKPETDDDDQVMDSAAGEEIKTIIYNTLADLMEGRHEA